MGSEIPNQKIQSLHQTHLWDCFQKYCFLRTPLFFEKEFDAFKQPNSSVVSKMLSGADQAKSAAGLVARLSCKSNYLKNYNYISIWIQAWL